MQRRPHEETDASSAPFPPLSIQSLHRFLEIITLIEWDDVSTEEIGLAGSLDFLLMFSQV
jgi:hypothetical protein